MATIIPIMPMAVDPTKSARRTTRGWRFVAWAKILGESIVETRMFMMTKKKTTPRKCPVDVKLTSSRMIAGTAPMTGPK